MFQKLLHLRGYCKNEGRSAIGSIAIYWQILFFYCPLLYLFGSSFILPSGFSLAHMTPLLTKTTAHILCNSFMLAATTTLCCLVIALPIAYFLAFHCHKYKNFFLFLLILPFWTNCILHICAWFFVLERHGFLNTVCLSLGLIKEPLHLLHSPFSLLLMMIYYYLPFMLIPLYSSLERFDRSLLEASNVLGADGKKTLKNIFFPLMTYPICIGMLLVYIPAFGEFIIPELMGGDRTFFVGNVISLCIFGNKTTPMGMAFSVISVLFLLVTLLCFVFIYRITTKIGQRRRYHV